MKRPSSPPPPSPSPQDEQLLLLVDSSELAEPSFLTPLYQLVKGCSVSPRFSPEQRARIINGVRPDLTRAGLPFSGEAAWDFFIG